MTAHDSFPPEWLVRIVRRSWAASVPATDYGRMATALC